MQLFRVDGGPAKFGPGAVLGMTDTAARERAHLLESVDRRDGFVVATARAPLEFKVGEQLWLDHVPRNLAGVVKPIEAAAAVADGPASEPRPPRPGRR